MKKEITSSVPDGFGFSAFRLYPHPTRPDEWYTKTLFPDNPKHKLIKDFFRDWIEKKKDVVVPLVGNHAPFGSSIKILDAKPDGPDTEIIHYNRHFGTKNENFFERSRSGEIVIQDLFVKIKSYAVLQHTPNIVKTTDQGSFYHDSVKNVIPMYPESELIKTSDTGLRRVALVNGEYLSRELTRTGVRTQIIDGIRTVDELGFDRKQTFSIIDKALGSGVDCDFYTEVLAKANAGTIDLLTELGELPETIRYFFDKIKQFQKIITEMRSIRKAPLTNFRKKRRNEGASEYRKYKAKKTADDFAKASLSTWMEYRYAIMTLVYSLQDYHDYLNNLNNVYKTTRSGVAFEIPEEWFYIPPGWKIKEDSIATKKRVWIKRKYDPSSLLDTLLRELQTNVFKTAWELIPLSFVIDWFVNIGDLIDALTAYQPYLQDKQTYSISLKGKLILEEEENGVSVTINIDAYKRFVITENYMSFLSINNGLNLVRSLDALALMYEPIKKKLLTLRKP